MLRHNYMMNHPKSRDFRNRSSDAIGVIALVDVALAIWRNSLVNTPESGYAALAVGIVRRHNGLPSPPPRVLAAKQFRCCRRGSCGGHPAARDRIFFSLIEHRQASALLSTRRCGAELALRMQNWVGGLWLVWTCEMDWLIVLDRRPAAFY